MKEHILTEFDLHLRAEEFHTPSFEERHKLSVKASIRKPGFNENVVGTHKRVEIAIDYDGLGCIESTLISLTPIMALALVRRLIDTVDGLGLELSQIHSQEMYNIASYVFDGNHMYQPDSERVQDLEDAALVIPALGIRDVLPPSVTK